MMLKVPVFVFLAMLLMVALGSSEVRYRMKQVESWRWNRVQEADHSLNVCVTFAINQPRSKDLEKVLADISSPKSPNFRKWLTYDEVGSYTSNPRGTKAVVMYLHSLNVNYEVILRGEYVRACMSVHTAAAMLDTTFYLFERHGRFAVRAEEYTVPRALQEHVWFIANVKDLPAPVHGTMTRSTGNIGEQGPNPCNGVACPQVIAEYYGVPASAQKNNQANWVSIFNGLGDYPEDFVRSDITAFLQNEQPNFSGPNSIVLDGNNNASVCTQQNACSESSLDIQTISGLADQINIFWVGVPINQTMQSFEEALITFVSDVQKRAGDLGFGFVASMSYGTDESTLDANLMKAFNLEVAKAGSMGVTVVISSGDNGAQGRTANCNTFQAGFPGSSPYALSIGATMGPQMGLPVTVCAADPSLSNSADITSGGGFSSIFTALSYQQAAVSSYLSALPNLPYSPSSSSYVSTGRGIPDIAMLGHNFPVYIEGTVGYYDGTSASAPVTSALLSMINTQLHANGKSPLGFIQPFLYSLPSSCFLDVTNGTNRCGNINQSCCSTGFAATTGWDAATGLGGLDFACILQHALGN